MNTEIYIAKRILAGLIRSGAKDEQTRQIIKDWKLRIKDLEKE